MKYLSTFSGIEAATVAWHPLGWEPVGFSEIEPFPSAVLKHHYPHISNYGDITKFGSWAVEPFRLLVGGSPCQSFSVAGLRKGLADERGNLMLTFGRLAQHYRPQWVVWENVPGVLSSNGGRDFGTFLGMLAEFGYGFAYRIYDAQYFGVAQRRRRVFVVGYLGDWRPAAAVLFESHSLSGHPPPSRKKGKGIASFAAGGIGSYGEGVGTLRANGGDLGGDSETLISTWWDGGQTAATLTKKNAGGDQRMPDKDNFGGVLVPHTFKLRGGCDGGGKGYLGQDECAFTLSTHQDQHLAQPMGTKYELPLFNTLEQQGYNHASTQKRNAVEALHTLRKKIGAQAFTEWGLGILDSLQSQKILQSDLHGIGVRPAAFSRSWVVYCSLSRKEDDSSWLMQSLREAGCERCSPQGWESSQQLHRELGAYLSELSQPGPQAQRFVQDLWQADEGPWLLREALSKVQEIWRPTIVQAQSTHTHYAVRRLTPLEAEFLQGFPRGYTAIPWRGKEAGQCPDGPRYKALGNSMAVPVMRWIGERIQAVEELMKEIKQ